MRGRARGRAAELDARLEGLIQQVNLPPPHILRKEIRSYLQWLADQGHSGNIPQELVRFTPPQGGEAYVTVGPQIDKGPTSEHFHFRSGARLSFGLTLREQENVWRLHAYRFQLNLPARRRWEYFRFDLIGGRHADPLQEPRCHLHPGLPNLRVPAPVLSPLEMLDYIVFVIEPAFAQ